MRRRRRASADASAEVGAGSPAAPAAQARLQGTATATGARWPSYAVAPALCLASYSNTLSNEFSYDDNFAVLKNPDVRCRSKMQLIREWGILSGEWGIECIVVLPLLTSARRGRSGGTELSAILRHDYWGKDIRSPLSHKSYRPLTTLTFRSDGKSIAARARLQWLHLRISTSTSGPARARSSIRASSACMGSDCGGPIARTRPAGAGTSIAHRLAVYGLAVCVLNGI